MPDIPAADPLPREADEEGPRWEYGISAITEGQWNLKSGQGAWANRLDATLNVRLWRGARLETGIMATYRAGKEVADVHQDFSNINAPNRPFRLTHLGLQQRFAGKVSLIAGVRQAEEDYFCYPMAGLFTGASYGCLPTINDNYHINVYPHSALGLHVEYEPLADLVIKTTVYNGNAYDTFHRIFRFRPRADGIINLGSVTYTRTRSSDPEALPAVYTAGWNVGNHYREATGNRHTQAGFWLVAEQPLLSLGRVHTSVSATYSREFKDPEVAKTYWNAALAFGGLTRRGGTLAFGVSRAYYHDARETDFETTFLMPLGSHFSLQPALHYLSSNGVKQVVGQLRVSMEF